MDSRSAAQIIREEKAKLIEHMLSAVEDALADRNHTNPFIESVRDQFDKQGGLSDKQIEAIKKFYERV